MRRRKLIRIGALLLALAMASGLMSVPVNATSDINVTFPNAVYLACSWFWSAWFGYFADLGLGWIKHQEHGFQYCVGNALTGIWIYDSENGKWLWTKGDLYPYYYIPADGGWHWYLIGSSRPRWFVELGSNTWKMYD